MRYCIGCTIMSATPVLATEECLTRKHATTSEDKVMTEWQTRPIAEDSHFRKVRESIVEESEN